MLSENSFHGINSFLPLVTFSKGNLYKLFTFFSSQKVSYELLHDNVKNNNKVSRNLNIKYIIPELKEKIFLLYTYRTVKFKTNNKTVTLHFYYKDETLDYLVDVLCYYISFVSGLSDSTTKNITIHYYLLDDKKVNHGNHILVPDEVNSGEAYVIDNSSVISIWRKEELLKVTIHELIHGLLYDYRNDSADIVTYYQKKYNITSERVNTYEAYTEIFTDLIHSYLLARYKYPIGNNHKCYELFVANVGIEREYSLYKSSYILSLNDGPVDMNKFTNVLAYYIIRAELFTNLSSFIEYCMKYNNNFIKITNKYSFITYLKELPMVKRKKYNVTYNVNNYLHYTMKMTCLELDLF